MLKTSLGEFNSAEELCPTRLTGGTQAFEVIGWPGFLSIILFVWKALKVLVEHEDDHVKNQGH
jgi:hypothetical protein